MVIQPSFQSEITPKHSSLVLLVVIILLLGVFAFGLQWVFSLSGEEIGSVPFLLFDYAVGLTMIFLPCTLPLAFVIVPLVMGKSYGKGIGMAVSFGLGVTITLGIYGALIGLFGQALGVNRVETAKNILYALAGALAIIFALGELGLIRFRAPAYGGAVPKFIMEQKDLVKAGLLGLFLGNVGVGCPNPLFNAIIIPYIVTTGSAFQGLVIMLVQALGRITPLFILAFLGILGINATKFLVRHKDTVAQFTAWTTIFVGGFLFTLGLFGHDWWVLSGMHTAVEFLTQENFITNLLGGNIGELGHTHGGEELQEKGLFGLPISLGTPFLLVTWILPMAFYWFSQRRKLLTSSIEQEELKRRYLRLLGWFFGVSALLLIVVFGYYLPHMFLAHWSLPVEEHEGKAKDFHVQLSTIPSPPKAGERFQLQIALHDERGQPIQDLQVSHERILHIILVSEDLEEFLHIHPEDTDLLQNPQRGEFQVPLTLSKAMDYRVFVDGFREGIGEVSDTVWLTIAGEQESVSLVKDLSRDRTFDGYRVVLRVEPDKPMSGAEVHLKYSIEKDGKQVQDFDRYLGEYMHAVITPIDLSEIAHIHGSKTPSGEIDVHHVFPYPGIWKVYGQFQHQGKVITTEFMVEVAPGTARIQVMPHGNGH